MPEHFYPRLKTTLQIPGRNPYKQIQISASSSPLAEYKSHLSGQLLSVSVPFIIHIQQFKYKIAFVKFHQAILFYRDQALPGMQLFLDASRC
jgi:hypothetical protein